MKLVVFRRKKKDFKLFNIHKNPFPARFLLCPQLLCQVINRDVKCITSRYTTFMSSIYEYITASVMYSKKHLPRELIYLFSNLIVKHHFESMEVEII